MSINLYRKLPIRNIIILITAIIFGSCAYYNTMFNANRLYEEGIIKIANSKQGVITADIRNNFYNAIDKCWTLINIYGDSSSWADDALLLIGKSHYLVEEYNKSERFLDQFLQKYPKSDLIYEAKVWYAKVLIKQDNDEKALENLNNIIVSEEMDSNLKAETLSGIGSIYYKRGDIDDAIKYLKQCVEISDDDILSASSQVLIGNIYFDLEKYVDAIESYNYVLEFDPTEEIEFEALMKKVDAQIALEKVDLAIKTLTQMLRNTKIKDKYSLVEARLGDCFQIEGNIDFAAEHYLDVIKEYPRSLGSAKATYELAKLMEFYYFDTDSAKTLYSKVKQEAGKSEYGDDAAKRAGLLKKYLDLKSKIRNSYQIITNPFVDSTLIDASIVDTLLTMDDSLNIAGDSLSLFTSIADSDSVQTDSIEIKKSRNAAATHEQMVEKAKKLLAKDQYNLAEYFWLNMENYDSAAVAYTKFINTGYDSSKIPQAYHALSYIYSYKLNDSTKADSIDKILLTDFPDTPYSEYILNRTGELVKEEGLAEIDSLKDQYIIAEEYLFNEDYETAIDLFTNIAELDSGNLWAGKARYAVSWIYEKKLKDIEKAIETYTLLAKEYPKSEYAVIAKNKIKEPVVEIPSDTTKSDSGSTDNAMIDSLKADNPVIIENSENLEPERKENVIEDEDIPKEEQNDPEMRKEEGNLLHVPTAKKYYLPFNSKFVKKGDAWKIFIV